MLSFRVNHQLLQRGDDVIHFSLFHSNALDDVLKLFELSLDAELEVYCFLFVAGTVWSTFYVLGAKYVKNLRKIRDYNRWCLGEASVVKFVDSVYQIWHRDALADCHEQNRGLARDIKSKHDQQTEIAKIIDLRQQKVALILFLPF